MLEFAGVIYVSVMNDRSRNVSHYHRTIEKYLVKILP